MKKIFAITMLAVVLFGCGNDEVEKTTYQIINKTQKDENPTIEYLDGAMYDVVVFGYSGQNVVMETSLEWIEANGGTSPKTEVSEKVERICISFKMIPSYSPYYDNPANSRLYTATTYLITPGKNNEIELSGKTMMQKTRPD